LIVTNSSKEENGFGGRYIGLVLRVLVTAANVGEREGADECSNRSNRWVISVPFAYDMGRCRF